MRWFGSSCLAFLLAVVLAGPSAAWAQEQAQDPEDVGDDSGTEADEGDVSPGEEAEVQEAEELPPEQVDVRPNIAGRQTYRDLVDAGTIIGAVGGGFLLASFLTSSVRMKASGALDTAQQIAWIPFGGPIAAAIYDEEENHISAADRYREDAVGHLIFEVSSFVVMAIGLENVREGKWWKQKLLLQIEQDRLLSMELRLLPGAVVVSGTF